MRIQHNIMAMNAYRNYNNNTSALSKNLEKLSSGYKINRAGDDAAGLAISEKMRAQITGLKAASKNVKDGVSLVKTAEGALQEVHDMLNRMDSLATQSANGTYDNEVDRLNLQKEVTALQSEIDRIAESSNFNGKKLLDGSLGDTKVNVSAANVTGGTITPNAATPGTSTTGAVGNGAAGEKTLTVEYADASGKLHSVDVKYTGDTTNTTNATNMINALKKNSEVSSLFDISGDENGIIFTNKQTGPSGIKVTNVKTDDATADVLDNAMTYADGEPASVDVAVTGLVAAGTGNTLVANNDITINGTKYQFVANASNLKDLDKGVVGVLVGKTDGETIANLNKALEGAGIKAEAAAGKLTFKPTENGSPLKLQIGDTADEFNQLSVSVGDMHSVALGIGDLSIADQEGAAKAIDKIKTAINTVSSTRGDLGAIQNRLEHTQNNLSVMTENIQDAESSIRDTDVADEMMAYTKNNILIQSAQAMLAQANQVPQGVLQLLQ